MCEAYGNHGEYENQVGVNGELGNGSKNEISTIAAHPSPKSEHPESLMHAIREESVGKEEGAPEDESPPRRGGGIPPPA